MHIDPSGRPRYPPPVPLPEEFTRESLYEPEFWFIDELVELEVDETEHLDRLVALCDTRRLGEGPIVAAQRPWPAQPKHVPGIVMVQITGTLGNLHAVCALGLRMSEGWVGFGTNIHSARFRGLGRIGPPLRCELQVERLRKLGAALFVTYNFRFEQEGQVIYQSRQSASWQQQPA